MNDPIRAALDAHFITRHDYDAPDKPPGEWICSCGKKFGFSESVVDHLAAEVRAAVAVGIVLLPDDRPDEYVDLDTIEAVCAERDEVLAEVSRLRRIVHGVVSTYGALDAAQLRRNLDALSAAWECGMTRVDPLADALIDPAQRERLTLAMNASLDFNEGSMLADAVRAAVNDLSPYLAARSGNAAGRISLTARMTELLNEAAELLEENFEPGHRLVYWSSPLTFLDGRTPASLVAEGDEAGLELVVARLTGLAEGVFL